MKNHFNPKSIRVLVSGIAVILLAAVGVSAQEEHGFLNIVNLVPGDVPCKIEISGQEAMPGGLPSANATGWFIVPATTHNLNLKIEGYDTASGALDVPVGKSSVCVVFLQPVPGLDSKGKPARPRIRFKRCDALPAGKGFTLRFMSFCPEESRFLIGEKPFSLKLLEEVDIPGWTGAGFKITRNQTVIGEVPTEFEKGAFYLFVGTDHENKYCSTLVRADQQTLPPWMIKPPVKP
jgi:hypothetical protein